MFPLCETYVSQGRAVRFPHGKRMVLFLCGDVSGGKLKNIKIKKHRQSSDYQCFLPVGVTGFEPATTRPPDAYFNVCISLKINVISFLLVPWLTFWLTFTAKNQEWLVMK